MEVDRVARAVVHAIRVFRDPMRACHVDPISEGHSPAASTLSPLPSEIKGSEKETIPDANNLPFTFCVDSRSL